MHDDLNTPRQGIANLYRMRRNSHKAQAEAMQGRNEAWVETLVKGQRMLSPAEKIVHTAPIHSMIEFLAAGRYPMPDKSLANDPAKKAALHVLVGHELKRKDCLRRDALGHLLDMRPDPHWRDGPNESPLVVTWAEIPHAPTAAARELYHRGYNMNNASRDGTTPLMWRTLHKDVEGVTALLLDMNGSPARTNGEGLSAPGIARALREDRPSSTRIQTLNQIFAAYAKRAPRDEILGMAAYCADVRAERFRSKRGTIQPEKV